jgi:hypothetical protein
MVLLSQMVRHEASDIAERVLALMFSEDAGLPVERVVAHPDVGVDAVSLLTAPSTLAWPVACSLESTARKGIVANLDWHLLTSLRD